MPPPSNTPDLKDFQKRYLLSNKDMAQVCQCSLPTIQKWRSGEVALPGPVRQLMGFIDYSTGGDPARLREILQGMDRHLGLPQRGEDPGLVQLESSMSKVVDRLTLMLETRRKESRLAESEARYRSMLESHREPVCRWLPDTSLTYVNKAYADLYGKPGEDLIGRKWIDFIPKERRSALLTLISDTIRNKEPQTMVHESIDRDGRRCMQEWQDMPILDERGEVVELHSVGRDVTELVRLRREVVELGKVRAALMELGDHPAVIFEETGNIVAVNERFRAAFPDVEAVNSLPDLVAGLSQTRFHRLLKRLTPENQVQYRIRIGERVMALKVRLVGASTGGDRYVGLLQEEESALSAADALRVRLAREVVIDGQPVPFILKAADRKRIERKMAGLGEATRVDRIYVFTKDQESGLYDNVLEWCGPGIEPQIDALERMPMETYKWWMRHLKKGQWIRIEDVERMPRTASMERDILAAQGIRSVLVCPLEVGGKLVGFAGFDQNTHVRVWHAQELEALGAFKNSVDVLLRDVYGRRKPVR
jgi:PAS domain S-box-containing protein